MATIRATAPALRPICPLCRVLVAPYARQVRMADGGVCHAECVPTAAASPALAPAPTAVR